MTAKDAPGTIYLIHISPKLHYLGYAEGDSIDARLAEHRATTWTPLPEPVFRTMKDGSIRKCSGTKHGSGALLLGVANSRGMAWEVVRTWHGTKALERRLKNLKGSRCLCPACRGEAAYTNGKFEKKTAPAARRRALAPTTEANELPF